MQRVIIALICVFFVLFSLTPTIYETVNQGRLPAERQFELVHNFPTDYNFYLSRIREGLEGRTSVIERYTGEDHAGSYIQVFYLALGWAGRIWRVPYGYVSDIYHVARIVLGFTLLVMIWQFVKRAFFNLEHTSETFFRGAKMTQSPHKNLFKSSLNEDSTPRALKKVMFILSRIFSAPKNAQPRALTSSFCLLAFLLALTASTWPKLVFSQGGWRFGGYMPWWSLMDSLQRITFIPHLLAGQILIIGILLLLTNHRTVGNSRSWALIGLLGFMLGIIFPPGLLFVFAVLGVLTVLGTVFDRKVDTKRILCFGVFFFLSIPALLYLQLMTTFYPWKRLVEVDVIRPLPFAYMEYFLAVGPMLPFGLLALLVALIKKERSMSLSMSWVIAWLLLLLVFKFVPQQSPLRFSEMIPQVPLAVLAGYLFLKGYQYFISRLHKTSGNLKNGEWRMENGEKAIKRTNVLISILHSIFFILPIVLITIGLGVMVSSYWWQRDFVDHKMRAGFPLVPTGSYVMYPLKDFIAAIRFIDVTAPVDAVIFSETTAGNYIPVYSSKKVYLGHDNTVKYEEKQSIARQFFSGNMKPDEARAFLNEHNLRYIFFGPQEKEDGGVADLSKIYPFLQSSYSNAYVTVYVTK